MNDIEKVIVADDAAEGLLEKSDKLEKKYIILLILLLFLLIFIVSSFSFAIFNDFKVGSTENNINVGSVLFSYNENSNTIELLNTYPMTDEEGMNLSGDKEFFDFTISVGYYKNKTNDKLNYEISLIPVSDNTLAGNYVRINLKKNGESVLFNNNSYIINYSDLENSTLRTGKILYKVNATEDRIDVYSFRMWLSKDYEVDNVSRSFKVYVGVDAY